MGTPTSYSAAYKAPSALYPVQPVFAEGDHRLITTKAMAIANGDESGTKLYLGKIASNAIPDVANSILHHGSITSLTDVDIGLELNGVVKTQNGLANALNLSSAGTKLVFAAVALADIGKPIWQLLGLSSDPGVEYDIVLLLQATSGAAGTVSAQIAYAR